jgi:hypothetical protein
MSFCTTDFPVMRLDCREETERSAIQEQVGQFCNQLEAPLKMAERFVTDERQRSELTNQGDMR